MPCVQTLHSPSPPSPSPTPYRHTTIYIMSDSDSEQEQMVTLEDLEGSDTEMISGDEDDPVDILTEQRVTINNEVNRRSKK